MHTMTDTGEIKNLFLCPKQRKKLVSQPDQAVTDWSKALSNARFQVEEGNWDKAVLFHGCALEIADILLSHKPHNDAISRYIRTAVEFTYTLRHCSYPTDLPLLIAIVKDKLQEILSRAKTNTLIKPLTDVAFLPLSELNHWTPLRQHKQTKLSYTTH